MAVIAAGGGAGGGGAPTGAAGGDLSGTYPNPSVVDDSHAHTAATLPATMPPSAHAASHAAGGSDTLNGRAIGVLTQLDVDNLRVDGNVVASTDANGNVDVDPAGTGSIGLLAAQIILRSRTSADVMLKMPGASGVMQLRAGDDSGFAIGDAARWRALNGSTVKVAINEAAGIALAAALAIAFSSSTSGEGSADVALLRAAANILALTNASTGGAALELTEMTAPAAPAANKGRLYVEDTGGGKSRLVILFPSGAAQVIATEP